MKIVIAAVGRVKEAEVRALLDEYYGRARRYAELTEHELKEERPDRMLAALDKLTTGLTRPELVALEADGERLSSEGFAAKVGDAMERAVTPVFLIGGAEGITPEMRARSRWRLSLGPMTLPHRIARVVLAEQVYRAFTILRGEPYAREGRRT